MPRVISQSRAWLQRGQGGDFVNLANQSGQIELAQTGVGSRQEAEKRSCEAICLSADKNTFPQAAWAHLWEMVR